MIELKKEPGVIKLSYLSNGEIYFNPVECRHSIETMSLRSHCKVHLSRKENRKYQNSNLVTIALRSFFSDSLLNVQLQLLPGLTALHKVRVEFFEFLRRQGACNQFNWLWIVRISDCVHFVILILFDVNLIFSFSVPILKY